MNIIKATLRGVYRKYFQRDYVKEAVARGLSVGKNFNMLKDVIIDYSHSWHIEIGNNVTLAPRVHILAHDASTKVPLGYTRIGKVTIGSRVFVGAGTIILPGVIIGDDVIIAAGSIVSRDIPSGKVAAGNPAKVICAYADYISRKKQEMGSVPLFDEMYTTAMNISTEKKHQMNQRMTNRIAYVK